jgi:histone H3/H4
MAEYWMRCTECKTELAFGAKYFQCSVSTCNRSKFRLVFCSIVCWDSHLADARHRDAWAEEARAPTREVWQRENAAAEATRQAAPSQSVSSAAPPRPAPPASSAAPPRPAPMASSAAPPRPAYSASPSPSPSSSSASPSPAAPAPSSAPAPGSAPVRRVVGDASQATAAAVEGLKLSEVTDRDILIVVSKMKKYIKDRSGMNCSDAVADMLSDHVRLLCDEAIRAAARDERRTVLDRDVTRVRR